MQQPRAMHEREPTSRISREELAGLLDTTASDERITARMPAVMLAELLLADDLPPPPIRITFRRPRTHAAIEAAVDAAIETELHYAEIEAAIDAVVARAPPAAVRPRTALIVLALVATCVAGVAIMALIV